MLSNSTPFKRSYFPTIDPIVNPCASSKSHRSGKQVKSRNDSGKKQLCCMNQNLNNSLFFNLIYATKPYQCPNDFECEIIKNEAA